MERDEWRSFFLDVPASEKCLLAEFDPDVTRDEVVVVTQSMRVRRYDLSHAKVPRRPVGALDPPPGGNDRTATCARLFPVAEEDNLAAAAAAEQAGPTASPQLPPRTVGFDSVSPEAAVDAAVERAEPRPLGVIGISDGSIAVFNDKRYCATFKLASGQRVTSLAIVDSPVLVGGVDGSGTSDGGSMVSAARPMMGGALYQSPGTEVELATQYSSASPASPGRAVGASTSAPLLGVDPDAPAPEWFYTIAALDAEGSVVLLQPVLRHPKGAASTDGGVAVSVQRTVFRPFANFTGVKSLAASADGVLYYGGRANSSVLTCVPANAVEKDTKQDLRIATSFRRVRAMDAFRHILVCTRGCEVFLCDYRANTTTKLCEVKSAACVVHVAYPAAFVGCENGAVIVVSLVAKCIIAETATYSQTPPRSLRYSWERGIVIVVDETGAADLMSVPVSVRKHVRGPLSRIASGRVLRRAVEVESSPATACAKWAEMLVLERFVVPETTKRYLARSVVVP